MVSSEITVMLDFKELRGSPPQQVCTLLRHSSSYLMQTYLTKKNRDKKTNKQKLPYGDKVRQRSKMQTFLWNRNFGLSSAQK